MLLIIFYTILSLGIVNSTKTTDFAELTLNELQNYSEYFIFHMKSALFLW